MKSKEKVNLTLEDIYSMVESVTKKLLREGTLRAPMKEEEYLAGVKALGFKGRDLEGKNGTLWELPNPEWPEKSIIQVQYEPYHDDRKGRVDRGMLENIKKALLDVNNKKGAFMYNWFLKRDGTPNVDNCQTYIKMNNQFHWEQEPIYFGDNVDYASIEKDLKSREQANTEYANATIIPIWGGKNPISILKVVGEDGKEAYNTCKGGNDRRPINDEWFEGVESDKDGYSSVFTKEYDDGEHMFKACTVNPETGKFENFELFENKEYGKFGKSKKRPLW